MSVQIHFRQAKQSDQDLILSWHDKSYVKEFWDNSETQRSNVINYCHGNKALYDYWIGFLEGKPFALLMTSDASIDTPAYFKPYLLDLGLTYTIDIMIGEEEFLGKGLGVKTLDAFVDYLHFVNPSVNRFIIDPAESNVRACHVYEKSGFKKQAEFTPDKGYFTGKKHILMTKTIKKDTEVVYDNIGKAYDLGRRADPDIVDQLIDFLNVRAPANLLDVGCGTGNYTVALAQHGYALTGADLSAVMLKQAKKKSKKIMWSQQNACAMTFDDAMFDGATCILATHHIGDIRAAYQEIFRVLKPGSRLVIFTATPEQVANYWLVHYFPRMIEDGCHVMTSYEEQKNQLSAAGFSSVNDHPFYITNDLVDMFLHSGKYRPEIYLDENIRNSISTFARCRDQDELELGLQQLARDIQSGEIEGIINQFENELGDYMFIVAER